MSSRGELVALGLHPYAAQAIGVGGMATAVTAAGNNSQTGATLLTAGMSIITTSGASTNSVILPSAVGQAPFFIAVASAQTTVNVFPATGETIIDAGAQGAANAAITLAATKNLMLVPHANTWFAIRGA